MSKWYWEYRRTGGSVPWSTDHQEILDAVNKEGRDDWELVCVDWSTGIDARIYWNAYFKKHHLLPERERDAKPDNS